MKKAILVWAMGAVILLAGCRKTISSTPEATSYPGDNYPDIFQSFWNGMNTNYVFWGIDTTNWDNMYTVYKPKFDQLTIFDSAHEALAEQYFQQMTQGLIDSHYTLEFMLTGNGFSPSEYRKLQTDPNYFTDSAFPAAVLDSLIPAKYIDRSSLHIGTDTVDLEGSSEPFTAVSGTINGNILYLYFSAFAFSQAGANTTPVFDYFFTTLRSGIPALKGIIIDLRGNGGGEVSDLDVLVGQLTTAQYTFGYTRYKNGVNRLDYTPWAPAVVKPWVGGSVNVTEPVVVLADHLSVSMSEITTMAIKNLPNGNGKFIGTRTWGANGPLASSVYFDGGQFTIGSAAFGPSGYMFVYTSSSMFKYINGDIYEGVGVPPDIYARETNAAYLAGDDLVVDAALKYIGQ
ncbi:MAG TPA: S41 family peptidase [Puia sp.]|nr:S41 family peptidase [Puia sp.]